MAVVEARKIRERIMTRAMKAVGVGVVLRKGTERVPSLCGANR